MSSGVVNGNRNSIAGDKNTVTGDHNTVVGDGNMVVGKFCSVFGKDNTLNGERLEDSEPPKTLNGSDGGAGGVSTITVLPGGIRTDSIRPGASKELAELSKAWLG